MLCLSIYVVTPQCMVRSYGLNVKCSPKAVYFNTWSLAGRTALGGHGTS